MRGKIKLLHAADLHLDSPFEGLSRGKAAIRRGEQRRLLSALAETARREKVDAVLLAGDLIDGTTAYSETAEELAQSLRGCGAPVFIAPGNHDYVSLRSPYLKNEMPGNVHVFTTGEIECVELGDIGVRVYGAAFTDAHSAPLLRGFTAPREDGVVNILCMHGEVCAGESKYNAISEADLAASGMDYAALGHVHKESGLCRAGQTWYAWPGCPEGRGFDETGEKHIYIVELGAGECEVHPVVIAARRYESISVDVTGADARLAVHAALPDDTVRDIYRITLTGETDIVPDAARLHEDLEELFFELDVRDRTRLRRDVWERAGEDSLRGLFLAKLKKICDEAPDEKTRERAEQAARWGLAALDNGEEVARHEN